MKYNLNSNVSSMIKILTLCEFLFIRLFCILNFVFGVYYTLQNISDTKCYTFLSLILLVLIVFEFCICDIDYRYEYTEYIVGHIIPPLIYFLIRFSTIAGGIIIIQHSQKFNEYGYLLVSTSTTMILFTLLVIIVLRLKNSDGVAGRTIYRYYMKKLCNIKDEYNGQNIINDNNVYYEV